MYTVKSNIGLRSYQEDFTVICNTDVGMLLGIFDGHGGKYCAQFLSESFVSLFDISKDIEGSMQYAFSNADTRTNDMRSGSTASVVFISHEGSAVVAVVGDSPVIARLSNGEIFHGPDHNVRSNPSEAEAAISRGGEISGGYVWNMSPMRDSAKGLQMSRSFGDSEMGKIVSKTPEIKTIDVGPWLMVCSDGAIDPGHGSSDVRDEIVKALDNGASAEDIVNMSLKRRTGDNTTAIVWRRD